eukprot:3438389-Amphidinium_carterae.2
MPVFVGVMSSVHADDHTRCCTRVGNRTQQALQAGTDAQIIKLFAKNQQSESQQTHRAACLQEARETGHGPMMILFRTPV